MKMRAKLEVQSINPFPGGETINLAPVCGKAPFGPNGESEDNDFARWTPSGSLSLSITNPALVGTFKTGQRFYADFSETE